jgi:surface polysaccharide O-acyltransferase-like enzyme
MGPTGRRRGRVESLDVFRGLAILSVVSIHATGHLLHVITVDSRTWMVMAFSNRVLQFAVPAFLLLSTLLNLRPLLAQRPISTWLSRRLQRAVWPYILWSVVYLLVAYWGEFGALNPRLVLEKLGSGNGYYHLYFLLLIVELYALLPFLAPIFRRRPPFWLVALVTLILQGLVYSVNARWLRVSAPGSLIFWYLPSVALGGWLCTRWDDLSRVVRRGFPLALMVAVASLAVHAPSAMDLLRRRPLDTWTHQASLAVYAAAAGFVVLGCARALARSPLSTPLRAVGGRSLEIYILHPLVLLALDKLAGFPPRLPLAASLLLYVAACVLVPMAIALLIARAGLSRWVWGTPDEESSRRADHRVRPGQLSEAGPSSG